MARQKDPMADIVKDTKKRYSKAIEEMAEEVAYEIEKSYESVIDMFYSDYTPRIYQRTYSTYLGSNAYNDIFNNGVIQYGNSYFAGINVSSSNIPGNPYEAYKGWVFDRTFYKGIHGINRNDLMQMNKKRSKDNHITIRNMPKNMSPAPKKLMDKEFKKLTKKQNLDKMFEEAMKRNM